MVDHQSLWRLSADELSAKLDDGLVSATELLECFLDRHRQINPVVNAIVLLDEKGARRAAEASDIRIRQGQRRGRLDGVPITIKDNIYVGGLPATWGSKLFQNFVPAHDDLPVARLREAGAVIVGKTNTPEFAMLQVTENRVFGRTLNPWRLDLTPGGSSGGAAASVAAGICPLALATDAGGSIRRPAAYAGVVGFRPSTGRIPRNRGFPAVAADFQAVGPIARSVADISMLLGCIAVPDTADRQSLAFPRFAPPSDTEKWHGPATIRYVPRAGNGPVDPEIHDAIKSVARTFVDIGHRVEEADAPFDPAEIDRIWAVLIGVGMGRVVDKFKDWREMVDGGLVAVIDRARSVSAIDYQTVLDRVQEFRTEFAAWMTDVDALLTPSSAALPWPAERRHPETIGGQPASPRAAAAFATFVNAAGCPAINLPAATSSEGLPIGFQLVGRYGEDERLIQLGSEYERVKPWSDKWPEICGDWD